MKKNGNLILYIFYLSVIVIILFFLINNFWIAFLINQILIFIAFFTYFKLAKPKNKNFKKTTFFIGSVILQFAIGYGTNLTYNEIFPGKERQILGNTEKSVRNTEEILSILDDKELDKFKIELRKFELNTAGKNEIDYLINRLSELNDKSDKIERYINENFVESPNNILKIKGLLLLSHTTKKDKYIPLLLERYISFSKNIISVKSTYLEDYKTILTVLRNYNTLENDQSFYLAKQIIPILNNEFKNEINKIFLLKSIMSVNYYKQEAMIKSDLSLFIEILKENNKYIENRSYDMLNDLVFFNTQTFWCVFMKEIKKMNCDGIDRNSYELSMELMHSAKLADDFNYNLSENVFAGLSDFEDDINFINEKTVEQTKKVCEVFSKLTESKNAEIYFWLNNDTLIKQLENPDIIISKIENNTL